MIEITALNLYPVKALQGISLDSVIVGTRGLKFDREWLIVDHRRRFITQREKPLMATVSVSLSDTHLSLRHPGAEPLFIALDHTDGPRVTVSIWKDTCTAIDAGDSASQWLTHVLGPHRAKPIRLVRFPADETRPVHPEFLAGDISDVGFADGYPYLIVLEESLHQLNQALVKASQEPVPMNRFRGNIVIRGLPALQEHQTDTLSTKDRSIRFALRKPCMRCKVTTTDQTSGEVSARQEPLRTLVRMNPFSHLKGGFFGQNAILLNGAGESLSIGDELAVEFLKT